MVKRGTLLCVTVKTEKSISLLILEFNLKKGKYFHFLFLKKDGIQELLTWQLNLLSRSIVSKTLTITAKMVTNNNNKDQTHQIPKDNELWLSNEELQDASLLVYCEQTAGGFEIAF